MLILFFNDTQFPSQLRFKKIDFHKYAVVQIKSFRTSIKSIPNDVMRINIHTSGIVKRDQENGKGNYRRKKMSYRDRMFDSSGRSDRKG